MSAGLIELNKARDARDVTEEIANVLRTWPELQSERTREFLGGGDMAKRRRKSPGRPPVGGEEGSTQVALRIPNEDLEAADEIAGWFGEMGFVKSRSDILRAALRKGLTVLSVELPGGKSKARPPTKRKK